MTREEILKAAFALFESEGIHSLNMRKIAEKLGIGKQELYEYFEDKRELVSQSVEQGIGQLDDELETICRKAVNPVEMLIRTAIYAFDAFDKMKWAFVEDIEGCPAAIDTIHAEVHRIQRSQPAIYRQAVEEGYLLGEAYYDLLLHGFWEPFMAQCRNRDDALRTFFTLLRGSASETGWRLIEHIRREMHLEY